MSPSKTTAPRLPLWGEDGSCSGRPRSSSSAICGRWRSTEDSGRAARPRTSRPHRCSASAGRCWSRREGVAGGGRSRDRAVPRSSRSRGATDLGRGRRRSGEGAGGARQARQGRRHGDRGQARAQGAAGWLLQRARARRLDLALRRSSTRSARIRERSIALDQLATAFAGERVTREIVARQFRGLGEQHVWDLCDKAFSRDLAGAMRSLRTLLEAGEAGLMLLGAITSRLRDLIRVKSLPERLAPAEAARQAGSASTGRCGATASRRSGSRPRSSPACTSGWRGPTER